VEGEVAGGLAFGGDVPLADAGARGDPFVAGFDELLEVRVGQDLFRQLAAGPGDARVSGLGHPLPRLAADRAHAPAADATVCAVA